MAPPQTRNETTNEAQTERIDKGALDALRNRENFRKLIAELVAKVAAEKKND